MASGRRVCRGYKNTENVGQYRLIVVLHFLQSVLAQWVLHLDPPYPRSNSNSGSGKGAGHGKAERWSRFVTGQDTTTAVHANAGTASDVLGGAGRNRSDHAA